MDMKNEKKVTCVLFLFLHLMRSFKSFRLCYVAHPFFVFALRFAAARPGAVGGH
jgi:hypothetical protein